MPSQIEKRTQVAKRISQLLIHYDSVSYGDNPTHIAHQKTIRGGVPHIGRTQYEKLLIYGSEDQAAAHTDGDDYQIISQIVKILEGSWDLNSPWMSPEDFIYADTTNEELGPFIFIWPQLADPYAGPNTDASMEVY